MICQQQLWLGPARAGLPVVVWVDTDRLHVLGVDGGRIKSTLSRLSQRDLAQLRAEGGRDARPSPLPLVQPELPPAVEVVRLVNLHGGVSAGGKQIGIGSRPAGQRVRIRLDSILLDVIDEAGNLRGIMRCPLSPTACARLRAGRSAGPPPRPTRQQPAWTGVVGIQGTIQVAGQKIRVGAVHATSGSGLGMGHRGELRRPRERAVLAVARIPPASHRRLARVHLLNLSRALPGDVARHRPVSAARA